VYSGADSSAIILDYLHRLGTVLTAALILVMTWAARRSPIWMRRLVYGALSSLAAQIALGAGLALGAWPVQSAWISVLHLGLSLLMQAVLVGVTMWAFKLEMGDERQTTNDAGQELPLSFTTPFARLSLVTLGALFLLLVSGAAVAASGAAQACAGWPLCDGFGLPGSPLGWLNLGHRFVVLAAGLLVAALFWRAWVTQRVQVPVLVASTTVAVLFFAQAFMGARLVPGFPPHLMVLHQATAVAVWAAMIVQVISVGMSDVETPPSYSRRGVSTRLKDFLMLTKPVVVALLLVTTYAGMVIGARAWPSSGLAFWTLLGGFMAAGGSGAINQYIDRFDDLKMQRTQKRPIPAGRLEPGEGLAFGVGMALVSFYLVAAMVNFLAALLTLAGIIYYVLIYSLLLKKTTVQNIVIGGGAGAIPPLVGWAAATGGLNVPSLFLFAVVFMWTPPHFWALALVRRKDYARAGVPMLPVVRGEKETRWQIFIYTVELVALTLLLPLFGLGGSVYLVGAVALGSWLLLAAWKVWKEGGNKVAWKMYRYSSMYLAFLFVVLMLDALV
jgi:protoheme IX farnesyltransferase